jgi:hypothetical protein
VRNFEVINGLQQIFEKGVEHCKKCISCQGRYFKKETVTTSLQSSDLEFTNFSNSPCIICNVLKNRECITYPHLGQVILDFKCLWTKS